MSYSIGVNCHITLQHPRVYDALPYGFILETDPRDQAAGPVVSVQKEVDSAGNVVDRVFFSVLLADGLIEPSGSAHTVSRAIMYNKLLEYLSQASDITLVTPAGVIPNLCSLGHVSTEMHYADHSIVVCQLTSLATYYPPADLALWNASIWDGTYTTWSRGYWR